MDEYKGNSHKDRQNAGSSAAPERRADPAITGSPSIRKKNAVSKLAEIFFVKDIQSVADYLIDDMLIPWIRRSAWDFFRNGLSMMLFGEPDSEERFRSRASRVSYWRGPNRRYDDREDWDDDRRRRDDREDDRRFRRERRAQERPGYEDILFDTREDALKVLAKLDEIMARYRVVRVADVFEVANMTCESTDYSYGWSDISSAKPVSVREGGYILKFPRAVPLDMER